MRLMKDYKLPPLLQLFPYLKDAICDFTNRNIGDIPIPIIHEYINKCIVVLVDNEDFFRDNTEYMFSDLQDNLDNDILSNNILKEKNLDLKGYFNEITEEYSNIFKAQDNISTLKHLQNDIINVENSLFSKD